jgi:prefoldin subunit 5
MAEIDRELGELSARMTVLEREMKELRTDIKWMRDTVQQTKGGWKTIAFLISAGGLTGAILTWVAHSVMGK